jgi:uncharacterized protein YkwD
MRITEATTTLPFFLCILLAIHACSDFSFAETSDKKNPDLDIVAGNIVERTNDFRNKFKLPALSEEKTLSESAADFAKFMAATGKYGHESDGKQPYERANLHGYDHCVVLENIALKFGSEGVAQEELISFFVEGWEKSPEHRKNMLDPDVTQTGVAVKHNGRGYYYAVQMFGQPQSAMMRFEIYNRADIPLEFDLGGQKYTLDPNGIHELEICHPSAVVVIPRGSKNSQTFNPANGDRFEYRKNPQGTYSFIRAE